MLKVLIVEDSEEFAGALKQVLESQTSFKCEVTIFNPHLMKPKPTFTQAVNLAQKFDVVLLDNQLGQWRWTGANMAPSLECIMSVSSEPQYWTRFHFGDKAGIAYHGKEESKIAFLSVMESALKAWQFID